MRQVESYGILIAPTTGALVDLVNASIQKGWQPLGAPAVGNNNLVVVQAMVKYQESLTGLGGAV